MLKLVYVLTILTFLWIVHIGIKKGEVDEMRGWLKRNGLIILIPYLNTALLLAILVIYFHNKR